MARATYLVHRGKAPCAGRGPAPDRPVQVPCRHTRGLRRWIPPVSGRPFWPEAASGGARPAILRLRGSGAGPFQRKKRFRTKHMPEAKGIVLRDGLFFPPPLDSPKSVG
ncbi:hypothetical protein GCM10011345_38890 [Gemmobacter megaterium]|nr:hypothetical protein GCM10011345_38890 [Gemmobacter megaterium]